MGSMSQSTMTCESSSSLTDRFMNLTKIYTRKVASVSVLQHHCKNFKLTYSGLRKNELVEKLTAFSLLGQKGWKEQ